MDAQDGPASGQPHRRCAGRPHDRPPHPVIAIDGPAAAGKGTLARRIAATLGLPYLDTGLLYRAVGRQVLDAGGDPADPAAAAAAARRVRPDDLERDDLRGPEADAAASAVAAIPAVRAALLDFQRGFGQRAGAVLDGRDIGTVIFPEAPVKLFVTAAWPSARARRWLELRARGVAADLAAVEREMLARDTRDCGRDAAPLRPADDAFLLDTTTLDAEAAFETALRLVRDRLAAPAASDRAIGEAARRSVPPRTLTRRRCLLDLRQGLRPWNPFIGSREGAADRATNATVLWDEGTGTLRS